MKSEWKPIDSAPKTGRILVYNAFFGVYSSEYTEERKACSDKPFSECELIWAGYPLGLTEVGFGKWYCYATHWMALPEGPES